MRVTLQKAKSWGRPCRPGDKFPWEASVTTHLKVVYRKQSAIKLWDTSVLTEAFYARSGSYFPPRMLSKNSSLVFV